VRSAGVERQLVEQGAVVRTEARERREVVAALEHIDRVDLQQVDAIDQ
jgi:hypothetical protein